MLREVGAHFTVNRMLTRRMLQAAAGIKGLTFFEFNYMIMQAYDFYHVAQTAQLHACRLGGDDQWCNMLAGVELIRRKEQQPAFCLTCKPVDHQRRHVRWAKPKKAPSGWMRKNASAL